MSGEETLSLEPAFIEDVASYLEEFKLSDVDEALDTMRQKHQMYSLAENRALARRQKLLKQQMHLAKSLECVRLLEEKSEAEEEAIVDYSLGASVFAKARVPPVKSVNIWLGVDVMAEYPLREASEMLQDTLNKCEKNLESNHESWSKIKDCKTTLEVNIARCYNHSVEKRKSKPPGS